MKRVVLIGIIFFMAGIFLGLIPERSFAVPSFARQTGKSCSGCHTVWPRLNVIGRDFKEMGYTDVADDYPRIQLDTLDLLRYGPPISISIMSFPYSKSTAKGSDSKQGETTIPSEVAFYFAGRITPNIGTFIEPHWAREEEGNFNLTFELAKITGATRWGTSTVGLVMLKSDVAGADPFNTIRFTAYHTVNTPAIFTQARASGDFFMFSATENEGILAEARVIDNMIYAAAGIFRGDGNAARVESDPLDFFYRLAFEYAFNPETVASLGGFFYDGEEKYDHGPAFRPNYRSDITRYGGDFQFQFESFPHNIDALFVYMGGKDKDAFDGVSSFSDVKFKGFYGEASYFYDRTYGVTVGYDYLTSDEDRSLDKKGPTFNIAYLPWANTKFALEYSRFKLDDGNTEEDYNFLVHLYF